MIEFALKRCNFGFEAEVFKADKVFLGVEWGSEELLLAWNRGKESGLATDAAAVEGGFAGIAA